MDSWLTPFASELLSVLPGVSPEQVRRDAYFWWQLAGCACGSRGGSVVPRRDAPSQVEFANGGLPVSSGSGLLK